MFDYQGYGRAYPPRRRQIVIAATHTASDQTYRWLNDVVCVGSGEVRVPDLPAEKITQMDVELVIDVSELVWGRPPAEAGSDRLRRAENLP